MAVEVQQGSAAHLGVGNVLALVAGLPLGLIVEGGKRGAATTACTARVSFPGCQARGEPVPAARRRPPYLIAVVSLEQPVEPVPVAPTGHSQVKPPCRARSKQRAVASGGQAIWDEREKKEEQNTPAS